MTPAAPDEAEMIAQFEMGSAMPDGWYLWCGERRVAGPFLSERDAERFAREVGNGRA